MARHPDNAPARSSSTLFGPAATYYFVRDDAAVQQGSVSAFPLHEGGGALLRGVMQRTPHVGYVLSGSILGAVEELIGPKGPLRGIDRLEVAGIDPAHLVPWLHHRLESHGGAAKRLSPGRSTSERVR